jgi:hypothetical protein
MLMLAIAARLAVRFPETAEKSRIPAGGVQIFLAAAAVLWIAGTLLAPVRALPTRPPLSVQYFRVHATLGGEICLLGVLIWFVWQQWRRIRAGVAVGLLARSQATVAAHALVVVGVLLALFSLANQRLDRAHQNAFARACDDVMADKLGEGWQDRYFGPARALLSEPPAGAGGGKGTSAASVPAAATAGSDAAQVRH